MKPMVPAKHYVGRLVHHFRADGWRKTAHVVGTNLIWPYCEWLTRRRIRTHEKFDARYGLDTQQRVLIRYLEKSAPAARYAHPYEGAAIPLVHRILRRMRIDLSRFDFIDLGSGKGRVLLVAAQYPFKSVTGVEFSETLHQIAKSNIVKFSEKAAIRTRPHSINMDAGEFDFSKFGNKIIFCNNPFSAVLMVRVLDHLEYSVATNGNEARIVYLSPIPDPVKAKLETFQLIEQGNYLSHYGGFQKYYIYRIIPKGGIAHLV